MKKMDSYFVEASAVIENGAQIGEGTKIWHDCQVRRGAKIGKNCILGKGVFLDSGVVIGDAVKIQNYVSIYHGVTVGNGVFIGPHVCFTNDLFPRAVNKDGSPKQSNDWTVVETWIADGASLGANSTIRCGIKIGEWAMVGAGSVVTKDVSPYALVYGNPARFQGYVCKCGERLLLVSKDLKSAHYQCPMCKEEYSFCY